MLAIATESKDEQAAIAASKVILNMAVSKAHVQEQQSGRTGFTIVIENATLQALTKQQEKPVDASYKQIEVDSNGIGS
jgi:hypothetical protein